MDTEYQKIGLKVGLEVHQQLHTSAKLFCNCKPELFKEDPEITFLRRLRPTQSELGQIDPAAYFEFQKGTKILYEANTATSCLVEMDEEPPHPLNIEAVEIALTVALMMKAKPVDEIHVMRKIVIDGSNTAGFQRTCVTALDGEVKIGEKIVPIQFIGLEEDSARKMGKEEDNVTTYRIDRLGVPEIEVATGPVINSPKEAKEVAFAIGRILRATGKVKRGLGTIRQDLNISIPNGGLIEIKGVQELELLPLIIKYEVQRQLNLFTLSKELREIGVKEDDVEEQFVDVTNIFDRTRCKVLQKALGKKQRILAVRLPKLKGFLKRELMPRYRLGTEISDRARFWGRVGGIFHTDELPAYGITKEETEKLKQTVKADTQDAIVFVADDPENAEDALKAVVQRVHEAIRGIPEETRAPNPDGTTRYMRPRPGAARMYPETDIPPIRITEEYVKKIGSQLPELPKQRLKRLMEEYRLNRKLARQVMDSEYIDLFETIAGESKISSTTVAVFLTETLTALKRDGVAIEKISERQIREIFNKISRKELTKEALQEVVIWLAQHENKSVQESIRHLDLTVVSETELRRLIEIVVRDNKNLIRERGEKSFGILMGVIMKRMRGRADAANASKILKEKLEGSVE